MCIKHILCARFYCHSFDITTALLLACVVRTSYREGNREVMQVAHWDHTNKVVLHLSLFIPYNVSQLATEVPILFTISV